MCLFCPLLDEVEVLVVDELAVGIEVVVRLVLLGNLFGVPVYFKHDDIRLGDEENLVALVVLEAYRKEDIARKVKSN